jgi:hypothetical protein
MKMTLPIKTLAAALIAAAIPLVAGPATAAPLSQSLALRNADIGTIEQVQYRRWDGYYAYGAAPGAYYAYGAAPGYVAAPRNRGPNSTYNIYGNGGAATAPGSSPQCPADRDESSSFPSWMCR